ncbi:hypothetical protein IEQ11_22660 [Lysobacter capsici]|uniref:hypothetical protein n=1 Tax=Lysobacter capsici TaxID=435897 RepID=UPI001FF2B8DF|nr:hypothetical protein [Lysobacter capsici]UOF14487.1 hypothetical protein IEQ11_22660 [Lysobacter capsici]
MAYKGLFESAHFCGRVISFDFGHYSVSSPDDIKSWARILKTYSSKLDLKPKSLLLDEAINLLHWNNGTVGLLDKHLWSCSIQAKARHQPIDRTILRACAPPEKERKAVAEDIRKGKEALQPSSQFAVPPASQPPQKKDQPDVSKDGHKQGTPPFQRKPNRNVAVEIALHDDD